MKTIIKRISSSYLTTIVLLLLYAFAMALATFIEKYHGTPAAKALVYYSPLFLLLQLLMVVNFIAAAVRYKLFQTKKWGFLVLHVSFIVILGGAFISYVFGEEGILHIREGETGNQLIVSTSKGETLHSLPFQVELIRFTMSRYPGSNSPSSYESDLIFHVDGKALEHKVFMNNVVDIKGYRFFQASYDKDEKGTILSVNRDVAGRNVTYTGYFLLMIGFVLCLTGKNSRFRQLSRRLNDLRTTGRPVGVILLFILSSLTLHANPGSSSMKDIVLSRPVPEAHAASFGSLVVQSSNGRMMPVNTFSSEILRKVHKSDKIGNLNSDQFLLSLLAMPEMWQQVPLIVYSNKELGVYYDLTEKECTYMQLFDENGNYKLYMRLEEAYKKMPQERNGFDKELIKLDEKANLLFLLFNYRMLNIFPLEDDPNHTWYAPGDDLSAFSGQDSMFVSHIVPWYLSEVQTALKEGDWEQADDILDMIGTYQEKKNTTLEIDPKRIGMELTYNRINIFRWCKIFYLILGGISLIFSFYSLFKFGKITNRLLWLLWIAVLAGFLFQTVGMGMRWFIGGYAPWSNSYETMVYVAWATALGAILFKWRSSIVFALGTLFAGIILFVSGLNWMDPQINTLVPVLKSPWLMFHVAVIVAAYGFFGISFLIGLTNLSLLSLRGEKHASMYALRIRELSMINEMSLIIGLALMTIGTFLGAIWANESWGRYWGWDPKETWALITVIIYTLIIHLRLVKRFSNPWLFNLGSVVAFASVLMTFFGVNYFLSGMHSYGQNDQMGDIFMYMYVALAVVMALAIISYKGFKRNKHNNYLL